jgi:hypothetical protein
MPTNVGVILSADARNGGYCCSISARGSKSVSTRPTFGFTVATLCKTSGKSGKFTAIISGSESAAAIANTGTTAAGSYAGIHEQCKVLAL